MTAVVSDTTPLNYLVLAGVVDVLPRLFSAVFVPPAVRTEMLHPAAPEALRVFAGNPPPWLVERAPAGHLVAGHLQLGEREAITLALELGHPAVLLDEWEARELAGQCGLVAVGTVGLLLQAAERGLVHLPEIAARLRRTNFRASAALWQRLEQGT